MKVMKYLIIAFLLCLNFVKSQVGDSGYPFLFEKLSLQNRIPREEYINASHDIVPLSQLKENIKTFEIQGFNNQQITTEVSQLNDKEYINQNIYGKVFKQEIDISDDSNRIEYDGRYYYLYKITSSEAKALQIYFKKYLLTQDSKLFFYADNGFILGEFNNKNNPSGQDQGLEFGIQPIPGNTFYIELSYPVGSTDKPVLIADKIIHSFTEFYGGAYGTAGNCHKNVVCEFTGFNDKSRNIKSVGLMLYPIYQSGTNTHNYSASCSGNLMNNTAQNGEPYFLTAAHCIGYEAANSNINWSSELITLFNYEALTCASNGSNAPYQLSNNSVLGCTLLTQSSFNVNDYALLKLNGSANALAQYRVCYAGWDNNPNSYSVNPTNSYGIHHPQGDTKKISYVNSIYPVMGYNSTVLSGSFGYYSMGLSQNSQGNFLQNSWKSGIVEKGSSGSPLFNSFDRLVGSLSVGPDPSKFNCDAPNIYNSTGPTFYTYYSRFSNNYYTMSPWLNPNGTNVQSIGPYCPNNSLIIGSPAPTITVVYPPTDPPAGTTWEEEPIDLNGEKVHPANTWGKKIYLNQNFPQQPDNKFYFYQSVVPNNKNIFAVSENLYQLTYPNVLNNLSNLKLWGIYKIVDCNKLKYIKPTQITMKNPGSIGVLDDTYLIDVVGITENRVHILIQETRFLNPGFNTTSELQSYKIVNNELIFESYLTLFYNQPNKIFFNNYYSFDNGHLILSKSNSQYSCYYNEQNGIWTMNNNPIISGVQPFIKIIGAKVFIQPYGQNKLDIYNLASNSANISLQASLSNIFLSNPNNLSIFEKASNQYNIIYRKGDAYTATFEMMQLNLSNNSSTHLIMPLDFKNVSNLGSYKTDFIMRSNEIIKLSKMPWVQNPASEYGNYQYVNFKTDNNGNWVKDKTNGFKWSEMGGFNNQYIISNDLAYGNNTYGIRRVFSIREIDYLAHPYTMYNNSTVYSAAYHRPKKLDHTAFEHGILNGKQVFDNLILNNVSNFLFRALNTTPSYLLSDYNTRTYDVKTVILDNKTQPLSGNKDVYVYGKYSVDMKPGFSVSSSSGVEFHAIPQQVFPNDLPSCSLTFEDMLNPQLTEIPSELIYMKQGNPNLKDKPYYGEIVLNDSSLNREIIIDREVKLYPNPTKDILNIDFNGRNFKTLEVYSIDAKKIITKDVSTINFVEVNLSAYPSGIYMVNLIDVNGKIYPNKVIKK